jgi:hypothetical protein
VSFVSSTANNIRDAVQQPSPLIRKRPPRSFKTSSVLTVYSFTDSVGQYVLSMVDHGRYLSEGIKLHISINEIVIVVTSVRVLCARVEDSIAMWQVKIAAITVIKTGDGLLQIFYVDDNIGFQQKKREIGGPTEDLERLWSSLLGLRT